MRLPRQLRFLENTGFREYLDLPKQLKQMYAFGHMVITDFLANNGPLVSAAVSFYVFLSLVPVLLLAVAMVGYVLGSPARAEQIVFSNLQRYSPALSAESGTGIRALVQEIVEGRGAATGFGLLVLLWIATTAVGTLDKAINLAWDVDQPRGFFHRRLLALLFFAAIVLLLGISVGLTAAFDAVRSLPSVFGTNPKDWPWIWTFLGYVVPLVVTISTFTLIYKVLPNTYVPLRVALSGGLFAGMFWEIVKRIFSYYATNFASYSKVYGSLAGVILLMVWINVSAMLTLLGAEVASAAMGRRSRRAEHERDLA